MPKLKGFKPNPNPYRRDVGRTPSGPKCPYCGSFSTHSLKTVETGGFVQYRCSTCFKTFGRRE